MPPLLRDHDSQGMNRRHQSSSIGDAVRLAAGSRLMFVLMISVRAARMALTAARTHHQTSQCRPHEHRFGRIFYPEFTDRMPIEQLQHVGGFMRFSRPVFL